jgi:hypothetical protein
MAMIPSSFAAASSDPRMREVRMVAELVSLSRLTLLFAEAGANKSTVLQRSIMPLLQEGVGGSAKTIVVLLDRWDEVPLAHLHARIDEALERAVGAAAHATRDHALGDSLCTRLAAAQKAFPCRFVIVFDRFEEYLAAPPDSSELLDFEAQFVEAVNSRSLAVNFLLSLDEDAAPLLERFRERIPDLGDARIRLPGLDAAGAAAASPPPAAPAKSLVGSSASAAFGADTPQDDGAADRGIEQAVDAREAIREAVAALFVDAESHRQRYKRSASLSEQLEIARHAYATPDVPAVAGQSASSCPTSAQQDGGRAEATERRFEFSGGRRSGERHQEPALQGGRQPPAPSSDIPERHDEEVFSGGREPLGSSADIPERHDEVVLGANEPDASRHAAARVADARRTSARTRRLMICILVVSLSCLVVLATWRGDEPGRAPGAASPPSSPVAIQKETQSEHDLQAQIERPIGPGDEAPFDSQQPSATLEHDWLQQAQPDVDLRTGTPTQTLPHEPLRGASEAPQHPPGLEQPLRSASPEAPAGTVEARASAAPNDAPGPLLYIHVRSEAQRAAAERMVKPLARHGIRVTGIKVVSVGPADPDLRYFRPAQRAEALRVSRALDAVGSPPQRLKYIAGFENEAPRNQYELWLPPT